MRVILLTTFFITISAMLFAQSDKTTYHLQDGSEINNPNESFFKRIIQKDTLLEKTQLYKILEYYTASNQLKSEALSTTEKPPFSFFFQKNTYFENGNLKSLEKFNISGKQIDTALYCYPNGKLEVVIFLDPKNSFQDIKYLAYFDSTGNQLLNNGTGLVRFKSDNLNFEEGNLVDNKKEGIWKGVFTKGYKFEDVFEKGKLISGKSIDVNGKIIEYTFETFHQLPEYPGGIPNLMKDIADNYKYPLAALNNKVNGIVEIDFIVDIDGSLKDLRIKRDLGYGTGEAAIRLVKILPKWKPGIQRGIPIPTSFTLPIRLNSNAR